MNLLTLWSNFMYELNACVHYSVKNLNLFLTCVCVPFVITPVICVDKYLRMNNNLFLNILQLFLNVSIIRNVTSSC